MSSPVELWIAMRTHQQLAVRGLFVFVGTADHQTSGQPARRGQPGVAGTRQYIIDFDEAERVSSSREELVKKMLATHGDRGNVYTLWTAATAAFHDRAAGSTYS
jgi:hypothetical protein